MLNVSNYHGYVQMRRRCYWKPAPTLPVMMTSYAIFWSTKCKAVRKGNA